MSRYKVCSEWSDSIEWPEDHGVKVQFADIVDTKSSTKVIYHSGAYRVLVDGKPVKGKGGTVPFYGELAWAQAQRLYFDLMFAARRSS